jgi:hypothetical protein
MALPPDARHSPDFSTVLWNGVEHTFTPTQAAIVQLLWQALAGGVPEIHANTLLAHAESDIKDGHLGPLFFRNPAWKTLVVRGKRRGTYCLDPEAHRGRKK